MSSIWGWPNNGIPGPKGEQGPEGRAGPTGAQGVAGSATNTGATGAYGPTGAQGLQGVAGVIGPTGPAGTLAGLVRGQYLVASTGADAVSTQLLTDLDNGSLAGNRLKVQPVSNTTTTFSIRDQFGAVQFNHSTTDQLTTTSRLFIQPVSTLPTGTYVYQVLDRFSNSIGSVAADVNLTRIGYNTTTGGAITTIGLQTLTELGPDALPAVLNTCAAYVVADQYPTPTSFMAYVPNNGSGTGAMYLQNAGLNIKANSSSAVGIQDGDGNIVVNVNTDGSSDLFTIQGPNAPGKFQVYDQGGDTARFRVDTSTPLTTINSGLAHSVVTVSTTDPAYQMLPQDYYCIVYDDPATNFVQSIGLPQSPSLGQTVTVKTRYSGRSGFQGCTVSQFMAATRIDGNTAIGVGDGQSLTVMWDGSGNWAITNFYNGSENPVVGMRAVALPEAPAAAEPAAPTVSVLVVAPLGTLPHIPEEEFELVHAD